MSYVSHIQAKSIVTLNLSFAVLVFSHFRFKEGRQDFVFPHLREGLGTSSPEDKSLPEGSF